MKISAQIVLVVLFFKFGNSSTSKDIENASVLLQQTISSLEATLEFFEKEHRNLNLDAVLGTRIADGILKVLLHHIDYDQDAWPLSSATIDHIRRLQVRASDVSDKAIPFIAISDPPYYQALGKIIQRDFWTLDFASRDFTKKDFYAAWLPNGEEAMDEKQSDSCIGELLGTGPNTKAKCHISANCWELMTKPGYSGYSLTHQTFYLEIAYQMGCGEEMNQQRVLLNQPPPSDLVNQFCAATFIEAKEIEREGFTGWKSDLFMEQAVLCGLVGYRWFFSEDWLQRIFSWQDPDTGCFKGIPIELLTRGTNSADVKHRIKREEKTLGNGCLCHTTAVATGALAAYVRYIAEYQQMLFQRDQLAT
ncbi:UPF0764 protein C16orf89 homolog [Dreissena polymorpha]|uniref:Uncharacterized protein n=1 Tax=Dreissena polymorpha TaxID=45954 RepID=A0A9D4M4C3_DREPO|nr:UPF0764 protein C16orf89 homolog [Dreissena polymorpha]KAH3869361.1 hypothetical protein DPMN_032524 [Dreissena polymorpha]